MNEHLLMLDALHAAAPGVLDVVFGKDGANNDAPYWGGPIRDIDPSGIGGVYHVACVVSDKYVSLIETAHKPSLSDASLDLLTPSTACRIAGLCLRAGADHNALNTDLCWEIIAEAMDNRIHPETAARMVALTLRLAPKIAALKVPQ